MEKYTIFMDPKNQYSENEYTTQSSLQIQCNPYQATNGIFHRTRTKFHNLYGNTKNLEQPKQSWERRMELEESTCLTSGSTTKQQSSRQHGTGTESEIQINGTKQKAQRQIQAPMDTLSLTKEAKIYNGEKTTFLTSGAGKTGQPPVKE